MDKEEVKALVKKAKHGDAKAFGSLYGEYALSLYRFALSVLKNHDDAEDAVQSASVIAFRKIGDLKKDESFKSWFFTILYNECRKISLSKIRVNEVSVEDIAVYEREGPDSTEKYDLISLLDTLSLNEKSIVILSVFEGYNSEEIGKMLGMKAGSVRSSLSRLLKKLRNQIEGADNE